MEPDSYLSSEGDGSYEFSLNLILLSFGPKANVGKPGLGYGL